MAHEALRTGAIDLYPEYTGTGLTAVMKAQGAETDPQKVYEMVKAYYEKEFKLTWLKPSGVNNGYAMVVRPGDGAVDEPQDALRRRQGRGQAQARRGTRSSAIGATASRA